MILKDQAAQWRQKIGELILEHATQAIPGEHKMAAVVAKVAKWADEQLRWKKLGPLAPLAEAIDGLLLKTILKIMAQMVYDELKQSGSLAKAEERA